MGVQKESSHEKQLIALGRALQALREGELPDDLVKIALDYLQAEFGYALIWLGLYENTEHRLAGKGGATPGGDTAFLKQKISLNPGDILEQVVIQQRPMGVPDLREEARAGEWRKAAQKYGIQGTIIFPIRHKDRCFGVVLLGSTLWGTSPHADEKARLSMLLGTLADAFQEIDIEQQRQRTKRPDQPLLNLLDRLRSLPALQKRLEAVVDETHRFVKPDRTNIYWYEPQQRYFWKRHGTRSPDSPTDLKILAQAVNGFYQTLTADQLVTIGEAHSSLKTDVTGRLMQQIQAQSLIAAPILFQGELHGFLTVEGNDARIWTEAEKNYVRGVAQLLALTAPLEKLEATIQQVKCDQALTTEVTRALYTEEDWRTMLKTCASQLCQRLTVERFLLLLYDADLKKFEIHYQQQTSPRKPIATTLGDLNAVDWQMLERSTEAVSIENLEEDLKLMAWRQAFLNLDVRSLLVCGTAIGKPLEGLIILAHEAPRSWSRSERELLKTVSQQLGLLLHQHQLQRQSDRLNKTHEAIERGLAILQQQHQLSALERAATEQIAQLLQSPLTALITWQPRQKKAKVTAPVITKRPFAIAEEAAIPIHTDLLVQWALQSQDFLIISSNNLPPETRHWLNGTEIGQVLVLTLRTSPDHEPCAIILVADAAERTWTEQQLKAFQTLVNQFAWCRRYLTLTETLLAQRNSLGQLNWYKQRRLEETHRILNVAVRRLNELSHRKDDVSSLRYQQILRHMGSTLTGLTPVLKQEQWQLQSEREAMPLVSLLRRSLERLDALIKQRQLWSQVHSDANVTVGGDVAKIEFVLLEVLMSACLRSPTSGRLDIWCQQANPHWLELSITDSGAVDASLLKELEQGRSSDLLVPSTLDHPPGLHLAICKSIMERMGGEFNLYTLEDNRIVSRLLIPIAVGVPSMQHSQVETSFF
ncbi:GAF domain-containing protein [Phormidium tenue FACHB-886]|nr:GAF domain-containing protein [Phormidium tenue FACHB-886]